MNSLPTRPSTPLRPLTGSAVAWLRCLTLILLVSGAVSGVGSSQSAFGQVRPAQRFEAHLFDEAAGLGDPNVMAFAQAGDGALWLGTVNGVFRFDGAAFTEFGRAAGLADTSVYSLLVDRQGTLWAGTHGGLFRFDGHLFHEVRVEGRSMRIGVNSMLTSTAAGELVAETSNGIVSVVRDPDSGAWLAAPYRQRHPAFPSSEDTDGIVSDGEGALWFGDSGTIASLHGDTLRVFGPGQGVPNDVYVSLFAARSGQIWARGRKHILTWRPGDKAFRDLTPLLPAGAIVTLHRRFTEDGWGHILTPSSGGFLTWDGTAWTETTRTSAGRIDAANDLFADRENTIWIGTPGAGLLHSQGYGQWHNYSTDEGLGSPSVDGIEFDPQGRIWLGSDQGGSVLDPDSGVLQPSPLAGTPDATYIDDFARDRQVGMWASGTLGHLFHLAQPVPGTWRIDSRFSVDAYINRVRVDSQGVLWMATSGGLWTKQCPEARCAVHQITGSSLGKSDTHDLALAPDDSLWVASEQGLDHVAAGLGTHIVLPQPASALLLIFLDRDGTLWLAGRSGGVLHLRVESDRAYPIASYASPQLASDLINFFGQDAAGRLWIGTDHGVNVLADGRIYRITTEDGLIRDDTAPRTFLPQADGSVWIGTGNGVSHLLDPAAVLRRYPFAVAIDEVRYDNRGLNPGGSVPWNRGAQLFRFSAMTFRNNRKMLYHSQLLGFDPAETVSADPKSIYPQLPPGSYRFRVYAEDTGNGVVSAPAEFLFTLNPPWWQTRWARLAWYLLGIGLVAVVWFVLHLALLAQRSRLQQMVEERTEELRQQADHDALTGLLNRRALFNVLSEEIEAARKPGSHLCVAIVDLDHFKLINDTYGHLAGDEVLRQAADRLRSAARQTETRPLDVVGRYGGEEFLIIFKGALPTLGFERCEAIRQTICAEPMLYQGHRINITCSIGLAWLHFPPQPPAKLLAAADEALYAAKHNGRNQVECAADRSAPSRPGK